VTTTWKPPAPAPAQVPLVYDFTLWQPAAAALSTYLFVSSLAPRCRRVARVEVDRTEIVDLGLHYTRGAVARRCLWAPDLWGGRIGVVGRVPNGRVRLSWADSIADIPDLEVPRLRAGFRDLAVTPLGWLNTGRGWYALWGHDGHPVGWTEISAQMVEINLRQPTRPGSLVSQAGGRGTVEVTGHWSHGGSRYLVEEPFAEGLLTSIGMVQGARLTGPVFSL
jgi:hypothetical protein